MRPTRSIALGALSLVAAIFFCGCDTPHTYVVFVNDYPAPLVMYRAFWQAVLFDAAVLPGTSSSTEDTVAASANTAYVVMAPGWDPASANPPTTLIALQSKDGFSLAFNHTLDIPVDDSTFAGNCAAGSFLTQAQADFVTKTVFAADFVSLSYDAATCTTTGNP